MFDTVVSAAAMLPPQVFRGPERRADRTPSARVLSMMLDEIDYAMVLVSAEGEMIHMNRAAKSELDQSHPLFLLAGRLRARQAQDMVRLHEAVAGAALHGLRKLLALGEGPGRTNAAVIPLGTEAALLVLGKRRLSAHISVQSFARLHGLTPAETNVLENLCEGLDPREVAETSHVSVSTVRTQIGSIRAKTGAESIRALVRQVAVLPPMVSLLRR